MQLKNLIILLYSCFVMLELVASAKVTVVKRYDNFHSSEGDGNNDKGKGFNIGSGLRSIAQGSADQANSAVANQHAAAIQAAYIAKSTLAKSAAQAASTALAALAGKEVFYHSLQLQRQEAEKVLESEILFLQSCKRAISAAKQTANLAKNQANLLAAGLNAAQHLVAQAETSVKESTGQLAIQTEMVGKAKNRLDTIEKKLQSARVDFDATKKSARDATQSAQEAQSNVLAAGKHGEFGLNVHGNDGYVEGFSSELGGHHFIV